MPRTLDPRRFATTYPVLGRLAEGARARIHREARLLAVPDRSPLLTDGAECTALLLPLAGGIRVTRSLAEGREIALYRVGPGDVCVLSVSTLLGDVRFPAEAVVEGDLEAVAVPRPLFRDLVAESAPFRDLVFASFSRRITEMMELVEAVAVRRLDRRLAGILLAKGNPVRATHQELADELGSVREIVSRILKSFESEGTVRLGRGTVEIVRPAGLGRLAEGAR